MLEIPLQQSPIKDIYSFGFDKNLNKNSVELKFDNNLNIFGDFLDSSQVQTYKISQYVYNSDYQSIPNATWTTVSWNTEGFPSNSLHSNIINNSRFTISKPGRYEYKTMICWSNQIDGGSRYLRFIVNNSSLSTYYMSSLPNISGQDVYMNASQINNFANGDYVEVQVWHNHGSPINIYGTVNFSSFSIIYLGD